MKKFLSLFLTLIMCVCIAAPCAESFTAKAINIDDTETFYSSYATNTGHPAEALARYVPDVEQFRDYVFPKIQNGEESISVYSLKIAYSYDSYKAIREYIYYYMIELFNVSSVGISYSGSYIYSLRINYRMSAAEYSSQLQEVQLQAGKLLAGLNTDSLSDAEKILFVHDRLAQHCEYDYENYLNGTIGADSNCIYGSIVKGTAVCAGYSRGFMYLLRQLGIDAYLCSSAQLNHEWNIVYLNGERYHVDVTWDDPVSDIYGRVNHNNLLRSTQGMNETNHNKNDYDSSPIDTTYDNYYWQCSNTGFQLLNGVIYYFDSSSKKLCKVTESGSEEIMTLNYRWKAGQNSYYTKSYVRLSSDEEYLYYSTPDTIYRYNPSTNTSQAVYSPNLENNYYIFGFMIEDGCFYLDINNSANNTYQNRAENSIVYRYKMDINPASGVSGDNAFIFFNSVQQLEETDIASIFVNQAVTVEPNENGVVSTGAAAALKNADGQIIDTRTVVLFGDADGDLNIDARDAVIAACVVQNMLSDFSSAKSKAADADGDGIADISDVNMLIGRGLFIS